ncbi:hypothetical protein K504DRAFT_266920 [Pleomassaria siparia CBS 279.74]|uniref:Zn(2)-C6 fungal-type domain-containing protein n=1 Tax=Pleomassaria siparia CBS 279.74 TaxID=1314801 RepID=A0A6G1KCU2_9PLEO|nr:hypothetical protein K504DRAFT_266920 [Pleomassaria siparia CBS 279.74]
MTTTTTTTTTSSSSSSSSLDSLRVYYHGNTKHRITKRQPPGTSQHQITGSAGGGVFSCFSLAGVGDDDHVSFRKRSSFSSSRKLEVRRIRRKGACLRCRMLKRACSGEDPCKTCIVAARAAAGSRALWWMDCLRPSLQALNVFDDGTKKLRAGPRTHRIHHQRSPRR